MGRIRLNIDRLILTGFEGRNEKALIDGLHIELLQVLSDRASQAEWARSHKTPVLKLGRMPLEAGAAGGRKFGKQMARAVGKGLKP